MNALASLESILKLFPNNSSEIEKSELSDLIAHLKYIESYTNTGSSLVYVLNYKTMRYEYLNNAFEMVLVDDVETLKNQGIKFFMENCHPADLKLLSSQVLPDLMGSFNMLSREEKFKSRAQYNYRLRLKNGNYFNCLQQTSCIQLDSEGNPLLDLGFLSDLGNVKTNGKIKCHLSLLKEGSYHQQFYREYSNDLIKPTKPNLTKRQLEITKQLANGKTSQEIADILYISLHTVNTHKRNIFKRLGIRSATELVGISTKNGWV